MSPNDMPEQGNPARSPLIEHSSESVPVAGTQPRASMREKVRSLRIDDGAGAKKPSNKVLLLASIGWCLAMATTGTSILLGYKAFRSPGVNLESGEPRESAQSFKTSTAKNRDSTKSGGENSKQSTATPEPAPTEQVALESKG